jgi:hypothetical protein
MSRPKLADMEKNFRADLAKMSPAEIEAWDWGGWELAMRLPPATGSRLEEQLAPTVE